MAAGILASNIKGMMINGKEVKGMQLGSTPLISFPKWRTPEFADMVGGKTMKFVYPSSSPISRYGHENSGYNNTYVVSTGPYMLREIVSYDWEDQADDYSWEIMVWSSCIELFKNGEAGMPTMIYQCDTRVRSTYDINTGMPTGETVLSVQEKVRKETFILPADFGNIVSVGGSMFNVQPQVDGNDIQKRPYTLGTLSASDNIGQGMMLFAEFPTNIDTTWFPNPPAADEYGMCTLGPEYTLFSVDYEYTPPGQEWPSYIGYSYGVQFFANGDYDYNSGGFVADGTYTFSIVFSEGYMGGSTVCSKQYRSSSTHIWNNTINIPSSGINLQLGSFLNTNSKLLPYVKKIIWQ